MKLNKPETELLHMICRMYAEKRMPVVLPTGREKEKPGNGIRLRQAAFMESVQMTFLLV